MIYVDVQKKNELSELLCNNPAAREQLTQFRTHIFINTETGEWVYQEGMTKESPFVRMRVESLPTTEEAAKKLIDKWALFINDGKTPEDFPKLQNRAILQLFLERWQGLGKPNVVDSPCTYTMVIKVMRETGEWSLTVEECCYHASDYLAVALPDRPLTADDINQLMHVCMGWLGMDYAQLTQYRALNKTSVDAVAASGQSKARK